MCVGVCASQLCVCVSGRKWERTHDGVCVWDMTVSAAKQLFGIALLFG